VNVTGEYELRVARQAVWKALLDPEVLRKCIPGCRVFEQLADDRFRATVDVKVGPMAAGFQTQLRLTNVQPPDAYRLEGDAKAGPVGFGKGHADVALSDVPGHAAATLLRYSAEFQVGGKLAQLGSRMLVPATQKVADEFFGRLAAEIDPAARREAGGAATAGATPPRKPPLALRIVLVAGFTSALLLLIWGLWFRFFAPLFQ
jgi:carbon monoxide dehydrogenase subunit G